MREQNKYDEFVIETLKYLFKNEIKNKSVCKNKEIIVELSDGTKAKIKVMTVKNDDRIRDKKGEKWGTIMY